MTAASSVALLRPYFEEDDGSLPEVVVSFANADAMASSLRLLETLGARDVTVGGATWWSRAEAGAKPYAAPEDALRVANGEADSFHLVFGGIEVAGAVLPDLGVFVDPGGLTLDYRMGADWGVQQVESFLHLLRRLQGLGGIVAVPWWGVERERLFLQALYVIGQGD